MRLNHLNLRVQDPAACRAFYEAHVRFRHVPLPAGFHIGFTMSAAEAVVTLHQRLAAHTRVGPLEDYRPNEAYITFRCWDPDGAEIEVFWDDT
ncbi:MAG: hypothetical protein ACKVWR_14955 [Acidimicrobiales bacterium]